MIDHILFSLSLPQTNTIRDSCASKPKMTPDIRLDNCLMSQCNARNIRAAFKGKASSHSKALPSLSPVCSISCVHTTYSRPTLLRQLNIGSLTCAQIWVRAVQIKREGGGGAGTNKSALELTRKDRRMPLTLPHQGVEPRVFLFEFRRSSHWATSPVNK